MTNQRPRWALSDSARQAKAHLTPGDLCAGTPQVTYVGLVPGSSSYYYAAVDWKDADLYGTIEVRSSAVPQFPALCTAQALKHQSF